MKWVDQAITRPHRCAVVPYARGPFVDTGQDLDLEHVYVSAVALEHMASEMLGWVSPAQLDRANQRITELEGEKEALQAQLAEADQFADAIDGLTKKGMVIRKQPGRRPKKKETEEVPV